MLGLELTEPKKFISIFKSLKSILDEIEIQATDKGLELKAIDTSHITFVNMFLNYDFFDSYDCEEPTQLKIDSRAFVKLLKMVEKNDRVIIKTADEMLNIIFENEAKRSFELRLLDNELETPKPPIFEHPVSFELPYKLLKNECDNAKKISDTCKFCVDRDYFRLSTDGEFMSMNVEYLHGENLHGDYCSSFSLDKLIACLKTDAFSDIVRIKMGQDMAMSLQLILGDSLLEFVIAPRIESD